MARAVAVKDKLDELQTVHEEQLRALINAQVTAAKSKLPDTIKCKDCTNLVVLIECCKRPQCHMGDQYS